MLKRNTLIILSSLAMLICFGILRIMPVHAEDATSSADPAQKYNITFPVSTLGNCASLEACKAYCSDPVNKDACLNFAKSKGFYKPNQGEGNARSRLIIEKAKTELGCATAQECKDFCAKEENAQKCADFAKKYSIENGKKKIINNSILEKAKTTLGCTSEETCKALCQQEINREKCSQFAKSAGLQGGMVKIASMSGKNKEGFDAVKQTIEKCLKDPKSCEQNFGDVEKQLMDKSDEFCKSNPEKCKEFYKDLKESSRAGKLKPNTENQAANGQNDNNMQNQPPMKKDKIQLNNQSEIKDTQVKGISKTPSFFDWFFNVFLK